MWYGIGVTPTHPATAGDQPDYTPYLSDDDDSTNPVQHWSEVAMRGADVVTG